MIVDEQLVQKLAFLARMELSAQEIQKFSEQLNEIMTFFEKLQEVDTTDTEPVSQITGLENVAREDVPHECLLSDALLECSPQGITKRQIRVQKSL